MANYSLSLSLSSGDATDSNQPFDQTLELQSVGYQGEDEFAVVENALVQRFPVYDSTDADAGRTGKIRQVQYTLKPGEAGWVLKAFGVTEY
ncbi:hypothetical protein [Pseudomonas fluorescens]|uniref:hypothetical protein n=1 Tax=Pseudomonas fluorescens TaxID=294 RepID=UPI0026C9E4BC|nr:hypothetical protein [Pseudomonas fluorescens]